MSESDMNEGGGGADLMGLFKPDDWPREFFYSISEECNYFNG